MSRHANITELLIATIAAAVFGCSTPLSSGAYEADALMRVDHCVGDVVPLCASVRVTETGVIEYARRGKRTLKSAMAGTAADELRRAISALRLAGWPNNDDPIGSFVTIKLPTGKRTFAMSDVPNDAIAILQLLDREGHQLFGSAYRPIAVPR